MRETVGAVFLVLLLALSAQADIMCTDSNDKSSAINDAISAGGAVVLRGTCYISSPLINDGVNNVTIRSGGSGSAIIKPSSSWAGNFYPMMLVRGTSGFSLRNVIFEGSPYGGDLRGASASGLRFEGLNTGVTMENVGLYNILGTALEASAQDKERLTTSPLGWTSGGDYAAAMQASTFTNVMIKLCGSTGKPAAVVARNAGGGTYDTWAHNNNTFDNLWIEYAQGVGLLIKNLNTSSTSSKISNLSFNRLFVHGTVSLSNRHSNNDLVSIEREDDPDCVVETIAFTNSIIKEMENAKHGVSVGPQVSITWDGGEVIASGTDSYGFRFNGSSASTIQNMVYDGTPPASWGQLASIESMYSGQVTFRNIVGPAPADKYRVNCSAGHDASCSALASIDWGLSLTTSVNPAPGGSVSGAGSYDQGRTVPVTATPSSGYRWDQWTGEASGSANPAYIYMSASKSVTANFVRQYTMTTGVVSGSGTVTGGGLYDEGAVATVHAEPAPGFHFSQWASGQTADTLYVTMDGDKSRNARFGFELTTGVSPGGGTVSKSDPTYHLYYYPGEVATVTATASPNRFCYWTGAATGSSNPANITVNSDTSVTGNFALYTLTIGTYSGSGSVSVSQSSGSAPYCTGEQVTILATPSSGWHFARWQEGGSANPLTLTMNGDRQRHAVFEHD